MDIPDLSEVRRGREESQITGKGNIFRFIGNNSGQRGVGLLVSSKIKNLVKEIKGIPERVTSLKINLNKAITTFIQFYAPIDTADNNEIEEFYDLVEELLLQEQKIKNNNVILIGDWNSQIGLSHKDQYDTTGKYGYGKRNKRS